MQDSLSLDGVSSCMTHFLGHCFPRIFFIATMPMFKSCLGLLPPGAIWNLRLAENNRGRSPRSLNIFCRGVSGRFFFLQWNPLDFRFRNLRSWWLTHHFFQGWISILSNHLRFTWGCLRKWGGVTPIAGWIWMVYNQKSENQMDDNWEYPQFQTPFPKAASSTSFSLSWSISTNLRALCFFRAVSPLGLWFWIHWLLWGVIHLWTFEVFRCFLVVSSRHFGVS